MRQKQIWSALLIAGIIIYVAYTLATASVSEPLQCISAPEGMELPFVAESETSPLVSHTGFTVLFDMDARIPRWVAYELEGMELYGDEERSSSFRPDPMIEDFPADTRDYTNSGYDRGHMAPAADMKWSEDAMKESFYLSNICPQVHSLNAGDWKSLEELVRDLAGKFGRIYVVCGPVVGKATGGRIGSHGVLVPDAFFKALLVEDGSGWHSIAFVMDNVAGKKPLMSYARTVDEVEELVGLDLFYALPDDVEEEVEASFDLRPFSLSN